MQQATNSILLIRPSGFGYNPETALSNAFQSNLPGSPHEVQLRALKEFNRAVETLVEKGINVHVMDDTPLPAKPDAIFPNNWVSFHHDGLVILYPMCAPNRRCERRREIIQSLGSSFLVKEVLDISHHEKEGKFLEGTGSIVFDHLHKTAYGSLSPRTNKNLFFWLTERLGYHPVAFTSHDPSGKEIYHTNVMMAVGERFAVACLASVTDVNERNQILNALVESGHEIVDITFPQMEEFGGNMLELKNGNGGSLLALSKRAYDSLTSAQRELLGRYTDITPLDIPTIETTGGGSVRCMIAEIFLPRKD